LSTEKTLVLVKPDGVQRGLIGIIISRLEARGLRITAMKMLQVSREMALKHYGVHEGKPFFDGLVSFITSGPVVAMALEGRSAVEMTRNTMGVTDPLRAQPGTIRGDLGVDIGRNLVHGSDSPETAAQEIALFFSEDEILSYSRDVDRWITES
jgi:nucleoside-diphosphate kinase